MIIEKIRKKGEVEILSVFPVSDADEEYPIGVFFSFEGRKYMTYADNDDFEKAAMESMKAPHVKFEDLYDVTQLVVMVIMTTGYDFAGTKNYREAFENEARMPWPKAVCDLMHDIVRYRLHKFFHYGDGADGLCVYTDILSRISFPLK